MKKDPFKLRLQPSCDGSSTRLQLCGSVMAPKPPRDLGQWLRQLSRWTDAPVELALPVDVGTAAWFESWTDAVAELPAHHLLLRFTLQRRLSRQGNRDVA